MVMYSQAHVDGLNEQIKNLTEQLAATKGTEGIPSQTFEDLVAKLKLAEQEAEKYKTNLVNCDKAFKDIQNKLNQCKALAMEISKL